MRKPLKVMAVLNLHAEASALAVQFAMPDSDIPTLRMPVDTAILSYEFAQSRGHGSKELRLSSKHTQSDMLKMVNDMMSRACTGLMSNATLLSRLKVRRHHSIAGQWMNGSADSMPMARPHHQIWTRIWHECERYW